MFVLRSGLRFSFRALEVPKLRVRKRSFSLMKVETYLDSNNIGDDLEHETDLKPG